MNNRLQTDFLVPDGGICIGAGTVLSLDGKSFLYNFSETPEMADEFALSSDWRIVGQALRAGLLQGHHLDEAEKEALAA